MTMMQPYTKQLHAFEINVKCESFSVHVTTYDMLCMQKPNILQTFNLAEGILRT